MAYHLILRRVLALSLLFSLSSAHAIILGASCDGGKTSSIGMGTNPNVPRTGEDPNPFQLDSPILRLKEQDNLLVNGCGRTKLQTNIDVANETEIALQNNQMAGCKPGDTMMLKVHVVNTDGSGPYFADIDEKSNVGNFRQLGKVDGIDGKNGIQRNAATAFDVAVPLPADMKCEGGKDLDACTLRIRNLADAGPFGGCVPLRDITKGQGKGGQGNGGQGNGGQGNGGQGNGAQGNKGQGNKGQGDKGQGDKGQGDKGQGDKGQGDSGQGDDGQGNNSRGNVKNPSIRGGTRNKRAENGGQGQSGDGKKKTGNGKKKTGNGKKKTGNGTDKTGNDKNKTGNDKNKNGNGQNKNGNGQNNNGGGGDQNNNTNVGTGAQGERTPDDIITADTLEKIQQEQAISIKNLEEFLAQNGKNGNGGKNQVGNPQNGQDNQNEKNGNGGKNQVGNPQNGQDNQNEKNGNGRKNQVGNPQDSQNNGKKGQNGGK